MDSRIIPKIIRSARRTLGLEIHPSGEVIVRAPKRISQKEINHFIAQKEPWIKKNVLLFQNRAQHQLKKKFEPDEFFLLLGDHYPLKLSEEAHPTFKFDAHFKISANALPQAEYYFTHWYKAKALEIFQERMTHYAKQLAVEYKKIGLSNAQKRWGSCSARGNIHLNWRLIMAPLDVIDYVVVHELAHLKEMNHSPQFWQWVASILPDYAKQKAWLNQYGNTLIF